MLLTEDARVAGIFGAGWQARGQLLVVVSGLVDVRGDVVLVKRINHVAAVDRDHAGLRADIGREEDRRPDRRRRDIEHLGQHRQAFLDEAEKPIEAPSADHIALSCPDAALPLFRLVVTRVAAWEARFSKAISDVRTPPDLAIWPAVYAMRPPSGEYEGFHSAEPSVFGVRNSGAPFTLLLDNRCTL